MNVISVENITKVYKIADNSQKKGIFSSLFPRGMRDFFALNNVSFAVEPGDRVALVGKNGSGKSTLLKILSRITAPSYGRAAVQGRVSSLLEVGTGFHHELTGRENVYMNGIILGMTRREIAKKFDKIVAFAGVENFLDVPVKFYSSGMILRLAFAVGAFLESDILIIDEVLAVGDGEFQKKCINTMSGLEEKGKTLLFVSHNMGMVKRLCNRAIMLSSGKIVDEGPVDQVVNSYMLHGKKNKNSYVWPSNSNARDEYVSLVSIFAYTDTSSGGTFDIDDDIQIKVSYRVHKERFKLALQLLFYNEEGVLLFIASDTVGTNWTDKVRKPGEYESICTIPRYLLNDGEVFVSVAMIESGIARRLYEESVISFVVVDNMKSVGPRGDFIGQWLRTAVRPLLPWNVTYRER